MKKILIFCLLSILFKTSFSQEKELDSLRQVIRTAGQDTNRVQALLKLGKLAGMDVGNYDTALVLYNKSLALAQKLNYKKGIGSSHNNIGNSYMAQSNYLKALEHYLKSLKIQEAIGDKQKIAACYNNIAIVYSNQSNYPKTLEYYLKSLIIREEARDKKGVASSLNNIGFVYLKQSNYVKALEYYINSLKISEEIRDKKGIAFCYSSIGNVYHYQSNDRKAIEYYLNSLKISEEIKDKKSIAFCYNSIGNVYNQQSNYPKAIEYYLKGLQMRKETSYQQISAVTCCINVSVLYSKLNETKKAIAYADSAIAISREIGNINMVLMSYNSLAFVQNKSGNYKAAYEAQVKFQELNDSIFNTESLKQLSDLKTNYEVEKKEAELKVIQEKKDLITNEEKKKHRIITYAISVGLLFITFFAMFVLFSLRKSRKANKIIAQQKTEMEVQKHLVEEKQKEIVDSITYAKRLQQAILPPKEFITLNNPNNFVLYKPKDIVAGDFYWAEQKDSLFFIAAADSTGHGVPGAMVSVVCSNALNRAVKEFGLTDTGKILDKTRELVIETFERSNAEVKDGMDISLLSIDRQKQKIFWSGANNPLWYIQDNELKAIKADKQPIGKTDNPNGFTTNQLEFKENTTYYLFTDGLPDQFGGPNGKKFKYKQFSDLLISNNNLPLNQQCDIISKTFSDWKGNLEQVDDVCVIGIKI